MSSNEYEYLSEDEAEKLEVGCGFCDRRIRIRSLEDHIRSEHFASLGRQ